MGNKEEKEEKLLRSVKIRLRPTPDQAAYLWDCVQASRKAYNWGVGQLREDWKLLKEELSSLLEGVEEEDKIKAIKDAFYKRIKEEGRVPHIRKNKKRADANGGIDDLSIGPRFTDYKKELPKDHLFKRTDSLAAHGAITVDLENALKRFYKNLSENNTKTKEKAAKTHKSYSFPTEWCGYPKMHKFSYQGGAHIGDVHKKDVDYVHNSVRLAKIGWIKACANHKIPYIKGDKFKNPTISTNGVHWFLSLSFEEEDLVSASTEVKERGDRIIGVDLGQKTLAILDDGTKVENISKSPRYRKLLRRKKLLNRHKDRNKNRSPLEAEKANGKKYKPYSSKYKKIRDSIAMVEEKINDMKDYYMKNAVATILKDTSIKGIVLEDLNIKGMMKNKRMASALQETAMYKFKRLLVDKAESLGVEVREAPAFYASSQLCSACGYQNKEVKNLAVREWTCPECGTTHDRDVNAATNLRKIWPTLEKVSLDKEEQE